MLLLFGMCNVVPQGVIWWETSAGSIPFQLTTEVFANQRLGLSAFASEIMLESFEKKSYGNKKRFEKWQTISLHVVHIENHWDRFIYHGAGMRRPANTARAFSKEVIRFDFSQSRAYWEQLILSILRTIDSYWFFMSSETLWNFVNFAFDFCGLSNARSVGECALCRQSLRKEALDEILRVREPGAMHAEETAATDLTSCMDSQQTSPGRSGRKDTAWADLAARFSTWFASCVTLKQRSFSTTCDIAHHTIFGTLTAENPGSNCPRHRLRPMEEPPTKIGRGLHGIRGLITKNKRKEKSTRFPFSFSIVFFRMFRMFRNLWRRQVPFVCLEEPLLAVELALKFLGNRWIDHDRPGDWTCNMQSKALWTCSDMRSVWILKSVWICSILDKLTNKSITNFLSFSSDTLVRYAGIL